MTRTDTVQLVVKYLGRIATILAGGSIFVLCFIIWASRGRETVDIAVVGLFSALTGMTGAALGALGSMLVSTRSTENGEDPMPAGPTEVVVKQPPNEAVPVAPVDGDGAVDAGAVDDPWADPAPIPGALPVEGS